MAEICLTSAAWNLIMLIMSERPAIMALFAGLVRDASCPQVRWWALLLCVLIGNFALAILATLIVRWLIG